MGGSCSATLIVLSSQFFLKLFLFPGVRRVRSPPRDFYFMYNFWQDAGNRTRVAATASRCATNELHTSLNFVKYANGDICTIPQTVMCKNYEKDGKCDWGNKCRWAHGDEELQKGIHHHYQTSSGPSLFLQNLLLYLFVISVS